MQQQNEESKVIENESNCSEDNSEAENRENENSNNNNSAMVVKSKRGARGKKSRARGGILNSRAANLTHKQLKAAC